MRALIAGIAAAAGLLAVCGRAEAQYGTPFTLHSGAPLLQPADPRVTATPYEARVYGYYRGYADRDDGARYRRYRRGCDDWDLFWFGRRCGRMR